LIFLVVTSHGGFWSHWGTPSHHGFQYYNTKMVQFWIIWGTPIETETPISYTLVNVYIANWKITI
jgi:hypothetical protein